MTDKKKIEIAPGLTEAELERLAEMDAFVKELVEEEADDSKPASRFTFPVGMKPDGSFFP